jgi:proline racemase
MSALSFEAVSTVDYHTDGEPFRIVAAPLVDLLGTTVAECPVRAIGDPQADGLRKLLCLEPRGQLAAGEGRRGRGLAGQLRAHAVGLAVVP